MITKPNTFQTLEYLTSAQMLHFATHHRRGRRWDHGRRTGRGYHFRAAVHCGLLRGRERGLVVMVVVV